MKDELDGIKQTLRQAPLPKINPTAKQAAIALALAEFDKKNSRVSQGTPKPNRLKITANGAGQFIFGRKFMKTYQLAIIGTVCAFFVVWAFVPLQTLTGWQSKDFAFTGKEQATLSANEPQLLAEIKQEKKNDALVIDASGLAGNIGGKAGESSRSENKATETVASLSDNGLDRGQADFKSPAAPVAPAKPVEFESAGSDAFGLAMRRGGKAVFAREKAKKEVNADEQQIAQYRDQGHDKFKDTTSNPLKLTKDEPVSTFSIDVDTASYSFVRSSLNQNVLPQKNAVRVEELINYFPYDYETPANKDEPFKANVSVFPTPWNKETQLLHIGIKGYQLEANAKPRANLVFLIDTSGSMNEPNKLPLVQNALKLLLDALNEDDSVAIVTYAGNAGVALLPTKIKDKSKISAVIDNLGAAGSTAGAEGIRQAYQLAKQNLDNNGINRVILATDGDFNVGITDTNELKSFVERERNTGVTLSVLGFGMGNYNDKLMQTLAQNGNGNAAYIDTLNEARKTLVEEAGSTLFTIAKDVKIQVEFNPEQIAEYRLIGYETRLLNKEDFNNDKVDAGDIGSGHTVTALYEMTPVASKAQLVDNLRYAQAVNKTAETNSKSNELAFVKIRYKLPYGDTSKLITTPVRAEQAHKSLEATPIEARFASAVAAFGQLLRVDPYRKDFTYDQVITLAEGAKGADKFGYRAEFINLVRLAKNAPGLPPLR